MSIMPMAACHPLTKLQHWQCRTCWVGQRPLSAIYWPCWPCWPCLPCCWPCWPCWPFMSQATFRHLLTMLALFDIAFITTAAISFSLPQLSTYWKVREISKQWWRFGVTILISRCLTLISIILMLLSLRKGLGTPTALPLDDAFHPDVSHWIHLVAVFFIYFHFLFLFVFDVLSGLFWLLLLSPKN